MKTHQRSILVTALAWAAATALAHPAPNAPQTSPAEKPSASAERRDRRMQELDEKLHLTADQKAKIREIWKRHGEEARAARQEAAGTRREKRAERRAAAKAARTEIREVLNEEQRKLFDAMPRARERGAKASRSPSGPSR